MVNSGWSLYGSIYSRNTLSVFEEEEPGKKVQEVLELSNQTEMSKDIKHNYSLEELFIQLDDCNSDIEALHKKQKNISDMIYQKTKEKTAASTAVH